MRRIAGLVALCVLVVGMASTPVAAQTRVDALPETTTFTRARFELVLTIFGEPVVVGRGAIDTADRLHVTIQTLETVDFPAETVEAILYEGTIYTRRDGDAQWYTGDPLTSLLPEAALPLLPERAGSTITYLGPTEVAGIPTDHYQLWFTFGDNSVITRDQFIGRATPYLYKTQINGYADARDSVAIISYAYRYYDFDAPDIAVYRPAGALPRPGTESSGMMHYVQDGLFQLRNVLR
jgi:hypothetical protein